MPQPDYLSKLKINAGDVTRRRALFRIDDPDLARLAALKAFAERHMDDIVEEFYALLLSEPETRVFFGDEDTIRRVKSTQRRYFIELFDGRCDIDYVQNRLRVGVAHERIGLPLRWYVAAYRQYLASIHQRFYQHLSAAEASGAYESITKLVHFDMALAIDTYQAAELETVARHQQAIRELSTPVIRVYERLLLLPLIGTVDSLRAEQIMEALLVQVVEHQALVVILDIAGVPLVDTQVADYLLKATAAVKLLGAQTILTGISAQVARTIVELGVDISSMVTRSSLVGGLQHALALLGKEVAERPSAEQRPV